MTSANFLWLLRDFLLEYHHAKFGCNWTTNKGETEGGTMCPPQPIWLQKTPARIGLISEVRNRIEEEVTTESSEAALATLVNLNEILIEALVTPTLEGDGDKVADKEPVSGKVEGKKE